MEDEMEATAVVTGGAKGIGRAIARSLGQQYRVAILDVDDKGAEAVVAEIEESGGSAMFVHVDVSSESEVSAGLNAVNESLGVCTILVNNAGIFPRSNTLDMTLDLWRHVIDVNLTGTFLCSRAVAPGMLREGAGAIVNIGSTAGLLGKSRGAHYSASKGAIGALTKSLALEWAPRIRVNAVIPGLTDTDQPRSDDSVRSDQDLYRRASEFPLGRIAEPDDVANAVNFFVSDAASFVTGQSLCVSGGAVML